MKAITRILTVSSLIHPCNSHSLTHSCNSASLTTTPPTHFSIVTLTSIAQHNVYKSLQHFFFLSPTYHSTTTSSSCSFSPSPPDFCPWTIHTATQPLDSKPITHHQYSNPFATICPWTNCSSKHLATTATKSNQIQHSTLNAICLWTSQASLRRYRHHATQEAQRQEIPRRRI
jgi:hypothetical protein